MYEANQWVSYDDSLFMIIILKRYLGGWMTCDIRTALVIGIIGLS